MAATYENPVFAENFPDPCVLAVDGVWHAYGTNGRLGTVPLLVSTDLVTWSVHGDALPEVGRWATVGRTWAPDVLRTGTGRYVMYYTARSRRHGCQAIGVAVADCPAGPFVDTSAAPLLCQDDEGGSIDPAAFRDRDGRLYLHWKNDGNAIGRKTRIYGQALSPDGMMLLGPRRRLLTHGAPWQGDVIEAPQMVRRPSGARPAGAAPYLLFYSANAYDSADYAMGYAECAGPPRPEAAARACGLIGDRARRAPGSSRARQAEDPLGDQVALDLRGPAIDRRSQ